MSLQDQIKATDLSIKKWELRLENPFLHVGGCPLCEYNDAEENSTEEERHSECRFCPLAHFTECNDCLKTPYHAWAKARTWEDAKEGLRQVKLMIELLKELRDHLMKRDK